MLLRMPSYIEDRVRVAYDMKIETPVIANACLPQVLRLGIFFAFERRVAKIFVEKSELFQETLLNIWWCVFQRAKSALR